MADIDVVTAQVPDTTGGMVDLKEKFVDQGDGTWARVMAAQLTADSIKDAGPAGTVTQTYTASNDMTTAAAITPAPTAGQKIKALDLLISNLSDADIDFTVQMETSNNILAKVPVKTNSSVPITLRGYLVADVAGKKLFGKASAAGEVTITANTISEA